MLPFALGLLGLGALGQKAVWNMSDARADRQREAFGERMAAMQQGLDLSSEQGQQMLASRMMGSPDTIQYASPMLQGALNRAQENRQWQWGNENLTKAQQENLGLARERQEADIAEGRARTAQGWQQLQQQQAQAEWAQNNMTPYQQAQVGLQQQEMQQQRNPWTGPKLQEYTDQVIQNAEKSIAAPYRAQQQSFDQLMTALDTADSPASAIASVYGYARTLDPGGRVTEGDASTLSNLGGLGSQLAGIIGGASGKGKMDKEVRDSIRDIVLKMQQQRDLSAGADLARLRDYSMPADAITGRPSISSRYFDTQQFDAAERYLRKIRGGTMQPPAQLPSGAIFDPRYGILTPVGR